MPAAAQPKPVKPDTIQCFAPGQHVALSGATLAFAAADLDATARAYDPALHEAPLVVGHPKTDSPAYGWVKSLAHVDGRLEASPRDVNPEFAALVNARTYPKVSCAFWSPDAANNPVPGVYYLRHIGFLGGAAPAVEGLRPPEFAGGDEGVVEFSAEWDDVNNASLWRSLRDWLLGKFGQDEADRAVPPYLVASVEQGAQQELADAQAEATATPAPAFAAPTLTRTTPVETTVTPAQAAALQAENERLRQQLADQAETGRKARKAAAHADAVAFAAALVASAQLADGNRDLVVTLLDTVHEAGEAAGAVVQFGAGDAAPPLARAVQDWLRAALPPLVRRGRVATAEFAAANAAPEADMVGSKDARKAAIAQMFPDLPA